MAGSRRPPRVPDIGSRTGLCACGCGERTRIATRTSSRDGTIRGQPTLYVHASHKVRGVPAEYVEDPASGCWVWQLRLNRKGYGSKHCPRTGRSRMAHRVYWERAHDATLDESTHLHHLCGNPSCVNPSHLEPVSPGEHGGGREVRAIRRLAAAGVASEVIAHAFGIHLDRVDDVLKLAQGYAENGW